MASSLWSSLQFHKTKVRASALSSWGAPRLTAMWRHSQASSIADATNGEAPGALEAAVYMEHNRGTIGAPKCRGAPWASSRL